MEWVGRRRRGRRRRLSFKLGRFFIYAKEGGDLFGLRLFFCCCYKILLEKKVKNTPSNFAF